MPDEMTAAEREAELPDGVISAESAYRNGVRAGEESLSDDLLAAIKTLQGHRTKTEQSSYLAHVDAVYTRAIAFVERSMRELEQSREREAKEGMSARERPICDGLDLNELLAAVTMPQDDADSPQPIEVVYSNHRGDVGQRTITPLRVRWGSTDYHPEPQWLIDCWDHDKNDFRTYAMNQCDFMGACW